MQRRIASLAHRVKIADLRRAKPAVERGWHRENDPGSTARGYGADWQRRRKRILDREPLCRQCTTEGRTSAASHVDHILAKAHGGSDDDANLQPLCVDCHKAKTAREGRSTNR